MARYVESERDCSSLPRAPITHTYAVLAFYTGGSARMELNGEWALGAGDLVIVPAGAPHRMLARDRPEMWGLSFCVPCLAAASAEEGASLLAPLERVRDGGAAVVRIPAARQPYLESLFGELERVVQQRTGDAMDAVQRSLLTLILAEAGAATSIPATSLPSGAGGGSGVVVDALRFIERNCLRPLTLQDVAAAVGRSPAYVTTALTKATGRSAVQWITAGRMAEARRILLHSDEMVGIVAERVGYADATHFTRMFRREHGATPTAWRAAQSVGPRSDSGG